MVALPLVVLMASLGSCSPLSLYKTSRPSPHNPRDLVITNFAWSSIFNYTQLQPSQYLPSPSASSPESFNCTRVKAPSPCSPSPPQAHTTKSAQSKKLTSPNLPQEPGPSRTGCPQAISYWDSVVDEHGNVTLAGGQCRSVSQDCCQTVVCAPGEADLNVAPDEVTGRMWNPLTIKCVLGGSGGMWQSAGGSLFVQMEQPLGEQCTST